MAQKKTGSHSTNRPSGKSSSGSGRPASHSGASRSKSSKRALNWGLIAAIALLLSVYLVVTLFYGRGWEGWKDSWNDLRGNVSSMMAGLPEELGSSAETPLVPADETVKTVQVHFVDVGQGDCILIQGNGQAVLIDAGENDQGDRVAGYLASVGVTSLDLAIGTHPHSDHIGGLDVVLEQIPAEEVWMPDLPDSLIPTTRTYEDLLDAISETGAEGVLAQPGDSLEICGGLLEVLGPLKDYDNLNDMSLVTKFTYGDKAFLFTGDMEKIPESDLLAAGADLKADVLKMGHHGSSTSSGKAFVQTVNPDIFVIEVGEGNSYGHPHREILALLKELSAEVWRTDLNGNIVMTCDGSSITVSSDR